MTDTVVQLTASDRAFAEVAALFDDYRAHHGHPAAPERTHDWLHEQLTRERIAIAAAVHTGQVRGFVTTAVMPAALLLGTAWSIRDLYVAPAHRRRGVAQTLLRHVIETAREAGAVRVSLHTETNNTPALALYAATGFVPVDGLELLNLPLTPGHRRGGGSGGRAAPG